MEYKRLQFRHSDKIFGTRADALDHFSDIVNTEMTASTVFGDSLYAEPLVAKYKDADGNEQVILAVGTASGHSAYHLIDTAHIYELITVNSGNILTVSGELVTAIERLDDVDTDIEDQIKKNEVKIEKTEPSADNVLEEYILTNNEGTVLGEHIKVYKESALVGAVEGHKGAVSVEQLEDGSFKLTYDTDIEDVTVEYLYMVYRGETGELEMVGINLNDFLREHEAGDGIVIVDHKMAIKIKEDEEFLSVDENGLCTVGIHDAISNAVNAEEQRAAAAEAFISGAVASEVERATNAENALQEQITNNIVKIKSVSPSDNTVREEYALVNAIDEELGERIKIYKDSSIIGAVMGFKGAESVTIEDDAFVLHYGEAERDETVEYLYFIRKNESGDLQLIGVELENYLNENEFKDGLQVVNHEVSIKVKPDEAYLAVDEQGLSTVGIKDDIEEAVTAETERAVAKENELEDRIAKNEVKIEAVVPSESNVLEEYALKNASGETFGAHIKIYKDNSLVTALLGHKGGESVVESGDTYTILYNSSEEDLNVEYLYLVYRNDKNELKLVGINLEEFITEKEFGDGFNVNDHFVTLKIKAGEPYLAVDGDGIHTVGIEDAVTSGCDAVCNELKASIEEETNRALEAEQYISGAVTSEIDRAIAAENEIKETVNRNAVNVELIPSSSANVREEYAIKNADGDILGETIKIYKDQSFVRVQLGHEGGSNVEVIDGVPTVVYNHPDVDSSVEYLYVIYKDENGDYQFSGVNLDTFINREELGDGLQMNGNNITIKIKENDEFLTVTADGLQSTGIQEAIDTAVGAEKTRAEEKEAELENAIDSLRESVSEGSVTISEITPSEVNVMAEYVLKNNGGTILGDHIKIPKQAAIVDIQIGDKGGISVEKTEDGKYRINYGEEHDPSVEYLYFIYRNDDDTLNLAGLDLEKFIVESEFGDGMVIIDHKACIKLKDGEKYLIVNSEGLQTTGIDEAISNASESLNQSLTEKLNDEISRSTAADEYISALTSSFSASVMNRMDEAEAELSLQVGNLNKLITLNSDNLTKEIERAKQAESDIKNDAASAITAETDRAKAAEAELLRQVTSNKISSKDVVVKQSESGTTLEIQADEKTITKKASAGDIYDTNAAVFGTLLTIKGISSEDDTRYHLQGADGVQIGDEMVVPINKFKDGISVSGNVVSLKTGPYNEFLRIGTNSISVSGVTNAINNAKTALESALSAEAGERAKVDAEIKAMVADVKDELSGQMSADKIEVLGKVNTVSANLNTHVVEFDAFETNITEKLNNEITRAEAKENEISQALSDEVQRAQLKESNIEAAVRKNKIITNGDVKLTESETGTTIELKTDEKTVTKHAGDGNSLGTLLKIAEVAPTADNVRKAYQLQDADGTQIGATIEIPTEGSLISVKQGHEGDVIDPSTGRYTQEGSGDDTLNFVYRLSDGTYHLTQVRIADYFTDAHFGNGLSNQDGVISIIKGDGCEKYLVIGEHTLSIIGVDAEIAKALSSANTYTDETAGAIGDRISAVENNINELSGKSHTHSNLTVLEGIAADRVTRWDNSESNAKSYTDNQIKVVNDKIDEIEGDVTILQSQAHTHSNKDALDSITTTKIVQWDAAQPNVIESVSVNNVPLSIVSKNVDIDLSEYATIDYVNEQITAGMEGVDKEAIDSLRERIEVLEGTVAELTRKLNEVDTTIRQTVREYLAGTDYQIKLTPDVDNNKLSIGFADNAIFGGDNNF